MIPVWIVDDHAVIRKGIKQILQQESELFRVTAEASSVPELLNLFKGNPTPEAIILDLSMPGRGGLDALVEIRNLYPQLPILILSMHPEDQYAVRSLKAGAAGYLSKECAPEQLVQALNTITHGERYITPKVAHLLADNLRTPSNSQSPHETLSDREFQILILISQGKSLTEIGEQFFLSIKTVSTYRTRVLKKMNMKTNAELIQYAITRKLIVMNS